MPEGIERPAAVRKRAAAQSAGAVQGAAATHGVAAGNDEGAGTRACLSIEVAAGPPSTRSGTPAGNLLAVVRYGADAGSAGLADALIVTVPLPQLGSEPLVERWLATGPVRRGREDGVEFATDGHTWFGHLSAPAVAEGDLEAAARHAYGRILRAVDAGGRGQPYRFWNYVPGINGLEEGMERYQLFCRGRSLAFEEHYGDAFQQRLPAASAVGGDATDLVVYCLAGHEPVSHWENPRQVSAWLYPPCHGPRGPSFARATVVGRGEDRTLFLSGTASIVGHETRHAESLAGQVEETLRNIGSLLGHVAGSPSHRIGTLDRFMILKTYLRREADLDLVRERLTAATGGHGDLVFLRADMCRADLLLEIEGVARLGEGR